MARKQGGRAAQGAGTIRKKTVHRKGEMYHYWEARITVGHDPGTGRQIQRSFSAKPRRKSGENAGRRSGTQRGDLSPALQNDRGGLDGHLGGDVPGKCQASDCGGIQK